eukprot:scaffold2874_cov110-Alexandrium_tamarense.AAC.21
MPSLYKSNNNDVVTIDLTSHPQNTPLGMLLAPGALPSTSPSTSNESYFGYFQEAQNAGHSTGENSSSMGPASSNVTLVAGWEHVSSTTSQSTQNGGIVQQQRHQQLGPIQRSGLVRLGDRLVRINGKDVADWSFREVMDALKELIFASSDTKSYNSQGGSGKKRLKSLGFAAPGTSEWSRGTNPTPPSLLPDSMLFGLFNSQQSTPVPHVVHTKRLYSFVSFIGRWRIVDESTSPTGQENDNVIDQVEENALESLLEQRLNKDPLFKNDDAVIDSQSEPPPPTRTTTKAKSFIQYEIKCHIVFRDPKAFQHKTDIHNRTNANIIQHSWSVWKRYSQFKSLDAELRATFGWQMDALDDGKGIVFPRTHGLEQLWYSVCNSGGILTSKLGVSNGIGEIGGSEANTEKKTSAIGAFQGSTGNGLLGYISNSIFGSGEKATTDMSGSGTFSTNTKEQNDDEASVNPTTSCPYPHQFMQKRQKEFAVYWSSVMQIEDIFEFSDINSHRFGSTMASFLEVDRILSTRRSTFASSVTAGHQYSTASRLDTPVIREEIGETYGLNLSPSRKMPVFGLREDDDVSILSDGTASFRDLEYHNNVTSPLRNVVDTESNGVEGNVSNERKLSSTSSAISAPSVNSQGVRRIGQTPRRVKQSAKPAFQRQFLSP